MCKLCPNIYTDPDVLFDHAWIEHKTITLFADLDCQEELPNTIMWSRADGDILTKEHGILSTWDGNNDPYIDCEMDATHTDFTELFPPDLFTTPELFTTPDLFTPDGSDCETLELNWPDCEMSESQQEIQENHEVKENEEKCATVPESRNTSSDNSEPDKYYETEYSLWYQ